MANTKRKCKHCSEFVLAETGVKINSGFFCCIDHAVKYGYEAQKRLRAKKEAKAHKEEKERIKTLSEHMREAQQAFNAYIRERDKGQPCISCQRLHEGQYHAGHYLSVGARPELRFDERNVNSQCAPCNNHLSGNLVNYRIGLIVKIGLNAVEALEADHTPKRYRIEDVKHIKAEYREKLRELRRLSN